MKKNKYIKKIILFMLMLCTLFVLTGCVALEPDFESSEEGTMEMGDIGFDEDEFLEEEEEKDDTPDDSEKEYTGETEKEDISEKESSSKKMDEFYYNQLSEEDKATYLELWEGIKDHEDVIVLYDCDWNNIGTVFESVLYDHPEIYWVGWFQGVSYKSEGGRYEVSPEYFYGKRECEELDKQIKAVREEFLMGAAAKQTDYEKIQYTYEFLAKKVQYGGETRLCQNIETPLVHNQTVCAGYAKATKYLLGLLDIEVIYAIGEATNSEGKTEAHAWNIVNCEGDYCFVDTTWGDNDTTNINNYSYLCCDENLFFKSHVPDTRFDYPDCTTNKWDYYILNDMYYEEFSTQKIVEQMRSDIKKGEEVSMFKFENQSDYEQLLRVLTNNVFVEWGDELGEEANLLDGLSYTYNDRSFVCEIYWQYK